jgi:hypothetical protein
VASVALLGASWLALPGATEYERLAAALQKSSALEELLIVLRDAPAGSLVPPPDDGMPNCIPHDLPIPTTREQAAALAEPYRRAALRAAESARGADMYAARWEANCLAELPGRLVNRSTVEGWRTTAEGPVRAGLERVHGRRIFSIVLSVLGVVAALFAIRGARKTPAVDPVVGPSPVRSGRLAGGTLVATACTGSVAMTLLPWIRPVPAVGQGAGAFWVVPLLLVAVSCFLSALALAFAARGLFSSARVLGASDPELAVPQLVTERDTRLVADTDSARLTLLEKTEYIAVLARNGAAPEVVAREKELLRELEAKATSTSDGAAQRVADLIASLAAKRQERRSLIANGAPEGVVRQCEDSIRTLRKTLATEGGNGRAAAV